MSKRNKSSSHTICCFCGLSQDNELEFGKFYRHGDIVTHYYCLLLSSNMLQRGNDDQGILGFLAADIRKEIRRGKRLVCSYCKKNGATLGCFNVKCKTIFHYPCGLRAGTLNQFFGEFRSYCKRHRPKQEIETEVINELAKTTEVVCYICYERVDPYDTVNTMWAPCCKKNAWFHRKCVQQLAMSAGYFFKCPLCNDKKLFQKAMLEYGIFIPSQDASWELVPNAFQELLYRHDQCDAPKCLCPKGRKYTSFNAKWELVLCRTCGSQGIHMACGQLKWANPLWECTECISILGKSNQTDNSNIKKDILRNISNSEDSDSDISVGKDSPIPFMSSSPFISYTPQMSTIKPRPGPRTYKLRQLQISKELQNNDKQQTNANVNTRLYLTDVEQHNLQSTSSEEMCTNISNLLMDTRLHNYKDNFNSLIKHSKSQLNKLDDIITLDDDDDIEVTNCNSLNDIFIVTKDNKCEKRDSSRSRNSTIQHNKSNILSELGSSKLEKLMEKNNPNQNNDSNLFMAHLNTVKTENLSSQNEIKSDFLNDTIQSNPETNYTYTDLISNIKITNIVSLGLEELENDTVAEELTVNPLKQSALQNSNRLIGNNSTSQSFSSQNDAAKSRLKRKLDKTTLISTAPNINEFKKIKKDNNMVGETSQSSCISLHMFTHIASNENNVQIINNNTFVDVSNLQNRESSIPIEQSCNMDEDVLHISIAKHLLKMNESDNVLNNKTDAFTTLTNAKEDKILSSNTRSYDGDAGISSATESRNRSFTNDTRISCIEKYTKSDNSRLERSQISEQWESQNVEINIPKCKTYDKSNIYWQRNSRNTECSNPRPIPEYIRLRDLKFRVRRMNNIQMILYDKFSVNMEYAATVNNITLDAPMKSISQQNIYKMENEISINLKSGNILQGVSSICNKDISKCMCMNEEPESYQDDTKENLDPVTIPCKNGMDNLLTNTTLITSNSNNNNNNNNNNNQNENGNLTQLVAKIIKNNDVEQNYESISLTNSVGNSFEIATNCINKYSKNFSGEKQNSKNFNSDYVTNSIHEMQHSKSELKSEFNDSVKLIRHTLFHENHINDKLVNNIENMNETDFKVSIDLKKIKSFVDNNSDLFLKYKEENNVRKQDFLRDRKSKKVDLI